VFSTSDSVFYGGCVCRNKAATAINDLRGAVVKTQHGIQSGDGLKEMVKHLTQVGHLEVLGLAKGAAPIGGDYNAWLKTEGKKATAHTKLNQDYNALVATLFGCYSKLRTGVPLPEDVKKEAKRRSPVRRSSGPTITCRRRCGTIS
jgi:hypothetical protein